MKLLQILRKLAHPNFTCDICGREVFGGERICNKCRDALPWNRTFCPRCGRKVLENGLCLGCKQSLPRFDAARSAFTHEGEAANLVVRYKRGEKYLCDTLSEPLLLILNDFKDADALTFVPATKKTEKARGYNQTRLLAEKLSQKSGLELLEPAEKIRETESQKVLSKKERRENLKGCFRVIDKKSVVGRKIVIIDDTMTTGSTVNELADTLKRAGAEKVNVLTVTSVQYKDPFCKNS